MGLLKIFFFLNCMCVCIIVFFLPSVCLNIFVSCSKKKQKERLAVFKKAHMDQLNFYYLLFEFRLFFHINFTYKLQSLYQCASFHQYIEPEFFKESLVNFSIGKAKINTLFLPIILTTKNIMERLFISRKMYSFFLSLFPLPFLGYIIRATKTVLL